MNTARGLITSVVGGALSTAADTSINLVMGLFAAARDTSVVDVVLGVTHRTVEAMDRSLGGAALIWTGIFTNNVNDVTVRFLLDHLGDAVQFLYDLVKPANVVPGFETGHGQGTPGEMRRTRTTRTTSSTSSRRKTAPP